MKEMIKLGLILALFAVAACTVLAMVNNVTSPIIAEIKENEAKAAMQVVFSTADAFNPVEGFEAITTDGVKVEKLLYALEGETVIGAVVQASGNTYANAVILMGVGTDENITSIEFLTLTDTPGFGQKAKEPLFKDQFNNKSINDGFVRGSDIDGISGSTITTEGVLHIVKTASGFAKEALLEVNQ